MNLVNELSNELALAFLVEKKHAGKLNGSEVLVLIAKVKEALQRLSPEKSSDSIVVSSSIQVKTVLL